MMACFCTWTPAGLTRFLGGLRMGCLAGSVEAGAENSGENAQNGEFVSVSVRLVQIEQKTCDKSLCRRFR